MLDKIKRFLPHLCIMCAVVVITLFIVDQINGAMQMMARNNFKIPLLIFMILVVAQCIISIVERRKSS